MKVKLSRIPNWHNLSLDQVIDFCLDAGIDTIVNDYGSGLEFELSDLPHVWEDIIHSLTY